MTTKKCKLCGQTIKANFPREVCFSCDCIGGILDITITNLIHFEKYNAKSKAYWKERIDRLLVPYLRLSKGEKVDTFFSEEDKKSIDASRKCSKDNRNLLNKLNRKS